MRMGCEAKGLLLEERVESVCGKYMLLNMRGRTGSEFCKIPFKQLLYTQPWTFHFSMLVGSFFSRAISDDFKKLSLEMPDFFWEYLMPKEYDLKH